VRTSAFALTAIFPAFKIRGLMTPQTPLIGQVLGHYRVVEQIGAGGMGLVFRASDEQLERDVAIKVLSPGMLADEAARKRFRREALTLAKLNHPNIGTVYEFGSQDGLDFLVMEYVGGVAVDARLSSGLLPQKEIFRLGFQLADGLASAHEHGVIHRDLKPANLRLTKDNRLKILDFGLAQFIRQENDLGITVSISETKQVTGTLPYMSPEQLRGDVTGPCSDIWSAGVVLYELSTGRRPFTSTQVPLLIDAILNKPPEPPSALNPKISPGMEMLILKCLDKDPERRYQSARELRVDLDRLTMPLSQAHSAAIPAAHPLPLPVTAPVRTPSRNWVIPAAVFAGLIVLLAVSSLAYLYLHHAVPRKAGISAPTRRRTVAVLNFKNSTSHPEAAWLSTALPEMLTTELAVGEKLRTITGDEVAQMKIDLALPDSDSLAIQNLVQVGKTLGADLVVLGSYVALSGGQLRLDLHLLDVAAGETLLSVKEIGEEANLFDLVSRAGAQLREKCGVGQVNPGDQATVRAALPATPEASKLYAEGLAKLRVRDAIAARDLLQKAVAADPDHALAHSALADAWALLGFDEKARLSAKSAYDLSKSLSREERLLTEAHYRETSKEWDNAAQDYRTLFGFFPDNLEYGLLLAQAQARGGKGKEALATVDSLRRLAGPAGDDARIDLAASEASRALGDFKQVQASAIVAAQKARPQNARLVLARALFLQGFALENLGDPAAAMTAVEEAGRIYQAVGDRFGFASTLEVTAQVLADRGDLPAALGKFNEELSIAREVGNRRAESSALNNMANVLSQQGDADKARKMYEEAGAIFHEVSDQNNYAQTVINIASVMQNEGDLAGARKTFDQALTLFREINDQNGITLSLTGIGTVLDAQGDSTDAKKTLEQAISFDLAGGQSNPSTDKLIDMGDILQHLGDLAGARQKYSDALALARSAGDKSMSAYALAGLGSVELKNADLTAARKDFEEALSLRTGLGEKDTITSTKVAIAELTIEEGHPGAAEKPALEAKDEFQKAHKSDEQIAATSVLVTALLAEGKNDDALREVSKAAPIAAKSQNLSTQLAFAIAAARADAASHQFAAAKSILKEALGKETKSNYLGDQLEARLALEEVELKSPKSPASRARLEQLQKDAKEKGFNLIARKASAR
jgi:serine/threonine protein kinase/tetratricopeptide (TPR) repeat protein/TolB-like protein